MSKHKLRIRFAGICTHFREGVAAGVPHRVVLPDASQFTAALLNVVAGPALQPKTLLYYLMPHFAQLEVEGAKVKLDVPALDQTSGPPVVDGNVMAGVRLQVSNAVDRTLKYAGESHRLTDFVSNYTPSSDVAFSGRAAVYFDLYGGNVSTKTVRGGAKQTFVDVTTDGPPELLVSLLRASKTPARCARLSLGDAPKVTLHVKNLEIADRERKLDFQGGAFDFLLHYITSIGGIRHTITTLTPGMKEENLVSATSDDLARAMEGMADILKHPGKRVLTHPDEVTPSCSDSQYP